MNRKIGLLFLGCTTLFTPFFTVACNIASQRNTVIVQLAQGKNWPLASALIPLTEYYNNNFKDQQDFVKVELEFQDKTGTYDEFKLIKNVKDKIITNDYTRLPNIVVGSQTGAYILKQTDNLLNLTNTKIKKDLFSPKIANLHSILAGQGKNTNTLFNIPFDNSDLDALTFNYQLLNKMFELIKENGGDVDENAEIVKAAKSAADMANKGQESYTKIPNTTIWNMIKAKNMKSFKDIGKVDDSTFTSIQSIRDLSEKFTNGIELENSKVNEYTLSGNVFSIDYFNDTFYKELDSRIKEDKIIFKLNDKNEVDYNLVKDKDIIKEFKNLWEDYTKKNVRVEKKISNNLVSKNVVFQALKYENKDPDWGGHEIRRFQSAISFTPSVGAAQNKITNVVRPEHDLNFEKNNTKSGDIAMRPQMLISKKDGKKIFSEGGSSILPIDSKNSRLNQGTIKFLEWLYTGKNRVNKNIEEENWITLSEKSGYVMPLKNVINKDLGLKKLEEKYNNLEKELLKESDKTRSWKYVTLNLLESAKISLKSILNFETNSDVISKPTVQDDKTAQITRLFAGQLQGLTQIDNPTKPLTGDELIEKFKKIIAQH